MANLEPIGYQQVIVTFVFGFVALSTLIIRVWFRVRQRKFDSSDICAILQSAIQLLLVLEFKYGTAKADIPPQLRNSLWPAKLAYINQILFKLTTPLSKLSLCLLYRSMCSTSTDYIIKITRAAIWSTIVLIIGAYGSAFFISIFQCAPISKTWNKKVQGHCIDLTAFRMRYDFPKPLRSQLSRGVYLTSLVG
ncbi:hypothetical protein GQ44DRAFT_772422 [Phaeosphaeriaceae sp. PMI808]|nr:hypothetical protein GQ44DRAFT_772422 [Phaeosphaeriaceae sp. PMI808]